jgi:hypothetical protein
MPSGMHGQAAWGRRGGRPSDDPFLRALQGRLRSFRAPESLRARIEAMLAVEQASGAGGEPEDEPPR